MRSTTIRVDVQVHDRLAVLAEAHHRSLGDEIAALVSDAEERAWWDEVHAGYARLRSEPQAWADYLAEAGEWDATAADGLADADEYPEYQRGRAEPKRGAPAK